MSLRSELHDHATEVNLQNEASHAKKYFEDISIDLWTSAGTGNYQFELPYSKYERVYKNRYLYYQLKLAIAQAKSIDIIVSFLMESGVRMLQPNHQHYTL